MKVLGHKTIRIARLSLPGGFRNRIEEPRIEERAKSVARYGILNEPLVRRRGWKLICGQDRVAAAIRAGLTEIAVKLLDCSDREMAELEQVENIERRHDPEERAAAIARLVALYAEQEKIAPTVALPPPAGEKVHTRGRRMTELGRARQRVAVERGIKPESVKKAEYRHTRRKREAEQKPVTAPNGEELLAIHMLGMVAQDHFMEEIAEIQRLIDLADAGLKHAQASLTALGSNELPFPKAKLQRMHDDVHSVAVDVRGARPLSLCPYCKGVEGLQETCTACLMVGWIGPLQSKSVPAALWTVGDGAVVMVHGRQEKLSDFVELEDEESAGPDALQQLELIERGEVPEIDDGDLF